MCSIRTPRPVLRKSNWPAICAPTARYSAATAIRAVTTRGILMVELDVLTAAMPIMIAQRSAAGIDDTEVKGNKKTARRLRTRRL